MTNEKEKLFLVFLIRKLEKEREEIDTKLIKARFELELMKAEER